MHLLDVHHSQCFSTGRPRPVATSRLFAGRPAGVPADEEPDQVLVASGSIFVDRIYSCCFCFKFSLGSPRHCLQLLLSKFSGDDFMWSGGSGGGGASPAASEQVDPLSLADPDSRFATVLGVRLHYKECGQGPQTIILLHGFGASIFAWYAKN